MYLNVDLVPDSPSLTDTSDSLFLLLIVIISINFSMTTNELYVLYGVIVVLVVNQPSNCFYNLR